MIKPNQGSPEANGLANSKNLGSGIAKAMRQTAAKPVRKIGAGLASQSKSSASVVPSHRYQRFFGIRSPGSY